MRTRTWTILMVAALVSTGIGALAVQAVSEQRPSPIQMPTSESGAIEHFDAARAQAALWRDDAKLVRVGATEGPQVDGRVDPPFLWDTSGDAFVGNGAALVWTFGFASPALPYRSFWVSIGGDGSVLYARELPDPYFCCVEYVVAHDEPASADGTTTVSYSPAPEPVHPEPRAVAADVDAPAAVAAVLDHEAFANFSLDHPVFQANVELLPGPDGHSIWYVGYRTATHYGAGAAIDAQTGEVLQVGSWPHRVPCCDTTPPRPPPPPPEPCCKPEDFSADHSGSLGSDGAFDVSFPVDDVKWLERITVTALVDDALPHQSFRLDLIDGHGRVIAKTHGEDLLELSVPAGPTSGGYTALLTSGSDVLHAPGFVPTDDTRVTLAVEVVYADAPVERPLVHAFHGEVWPSTEQWHDLYVEGKEWRPMRPVQVTLAWDAERIGQPLELVLLDAWGNEIASAEGDATATGAQAVTLDVPHAKDECCMTALVRGPPGFVGPDIPYTLELLVEPWEPAHDEPHAMHDTHDKHDH